MLTSGNQYLRPEYLSPLPTTLDAKKSPLALLAQTCSNIGADNPNNKPILPGLEKCQKEGDKKGSSRTSPLIISDEHSNSKPAFKPYESLVRKEDKDREHVKTPGSKTGSPPVISHISSPPASNGKSSPATSETGRASSHNNNKPESTRASPNTSESSSSTTLCSSQNTLSGLGYGSSGLGLETAKDSLALRALGLNPLSNCNGCPVPAHPLDAYKGGSYPLGLSPYVGYAQVKTAAGTRVVPVCRDPYCTNCQFGMHSQLGQCPAGCTQCTHDRLGLPGLGHGFPGLGGSAAAMAAVAAGIPGLPYPHSLLSRPNVCSWMTGDSYCGKRFNSSEEVMQHLRTHTSLPTSESSLSLMSPSLSLAQHYSSANSLTSPAGLRRSYPTSLSPVSSLSAASRYHPYKSSLPTLPGAPIPQFAHPALGMYYPYSLYGQRLGPPVHP